MSVNYIDKSTGDLIRVAGQGKAEYGASTVRRGTIGVPAIAANVDYADQTITFSTPMPDTDYLVDLSLQGSNTHRVAFHVVANTKTVNGFTVRFTPIGVKQITEVGVSGVADHSSNYTLTVQRDDTRFNFTKNTAIVDPASSLPTEWNPMQTGYLRNPMPANEATLVYTAFKLYTDTEYNNLLNNAVLTSDVTDAVTNGDMNPVTSNAVAKVTNRINELVWNTEYVDLGSWTSGGLLEKCGFIMINKLITIKANCPAGALLCTGFPRPMVGMEIPVSFDNPEMGGGLFLDVSGELRAWITPSEVNEIIRINLIYMKSL